jgi:hypothetical protein
MIFSPKFFITDVVVLITFLSNFEFQNGENQALTSFPENLLVFASFVILGDHGR